MTASQFYLGKSGKRSGLALPADAVTRTFGIFGVKDSGKTTTARTLAEGIVKTGGNVAVLDPVGVWWGVTRDGEGRGIPGIVIGGEHGDVPLEKTGGELVADLCVARQWPVVVIDLKLLRKGAAQHFMADFLEGVYFKNRRPLHIVFEEADRALPQTARGMDPTLGRVIGAAEDIVKLGRSRGLGSTFLSQRIATVTKNVTEQVQALVLHAQPGPRDRKAVKEWVEANGDPRATEKVMESMASLDQGSAWFYSPAWLKTLELVNVRRPQTLDSSATPTNEEAVQQEAAPRAPVDLEELRRLMSETVERAEANDPKALHKRIAELEALLDDAPASEPERVLVPDRAAMADLSERIGELVNFGEELGRQHDELKATADVFRAIGADVSAVAGVLSGALDGAVALPAEGVQHADRIPAEPVNGGGPRRPAAALNADGMSEGAGRLVKDLERFAPLWLSRGQLAVLLRRGKRSSTLTAQLAEAVEVGALAKNVHGHYRVPAEGEPPSRRELREAFRDALPDGPRSLFAVLLTGGDFARAELFELAGFSATSSTPVAHLKLLTDNGLAERVGHGAVMLGPAVR